MWLCLWGFKVFYITDSPPLSVVLCIQQRLSLRKSSPHKRESPCCLWFKSTTQTSPSSHTHTYTWILYTYLYHHPWNIHQSRQYTLQSLKQSPRSANKQIQIRSRPKHSCKAKEWMPTTPHLNRDLNPLSHTSTHFHKFWSITAKSVNN